MNVVIQCPYCKRMLLRDMLDVLRVHRFYCDCAGKGFEVILKMEVRESDDESEEKKEIR